MNNSEHYKFMRLALEEANKSKEELEVPIGAVLVHEGEVISTGRNKREILKNALLHAEIDAINKACKKLNRWRLTGCTLYVTLEPCHAADRPDQETAEAYPANHDAP